MSAICAMGRPSPERKQPEQQSSAKSQGLELTYPTYVAQALNPIYRHAERVPPGALYENPIAGALEIQGGGVSDFKKMAI